MGLLPVNIAWQVISQFVNRPLGQETINLVPVYKQPTEKNLLLVYGRVISRDVFSPISVPSFNNSAMDGYALSYRQLEKNLPKTFFVYPETIFAGTCPPRKKLPENYIWRVMTGAPLPAGCDLVVPQEYGEEQTDGRVKISRKFFRYSNVRFAGEDVKKGQKLIPRGTEITPAVFGLLAATGIKKITVYKKPRVFLITTGKEIISPSEKISPGKIYNVNTYTLSLLALGSGVTLVGFAHTGDNLDGLKRVIRRAMKKSDIVLISAGVSVGKYDFTRQALKELGAKILFHRLAIKPARPVLLAKKGKKIIFGIPGNPASTVVAFRLFILPVIRILTGRKPEFNVRQSGFILTDFHKSADRRNFVRAKKIIRDGKVFLKPIGPHGSNIISSLVNADCLIDIPRKVTRVKKGQLVKYLSL